MTNLIKLEYERQRRAEKRAFRLKLIGLAVIFIVAIIVSAITAHAEPRIIHSDSLIERLNSMQTEVGIAPGNITKPIENITKPIANNENDVNAAKSDETSTQNEYSGITVSDEEYVELCKIVAAEAQTQSLEGQKAVVEVIFNRVLSPNFPSTVYGVLSQKGQFATWRLRNQGWVEPYRAVEAIASVVADGRTVLPDTGYVYFDTHGVNGRKKIKIGAHYFGK